MELHNQFEVPAPADEVWNALLDIGRVASYLPGAEIEPSDGGEVHRGTMRVKLGPMNVAYEGTARLGDIDEDARVASIEVKAKETAGQGTASATIRNQVQTLNGEGTRVVADTELNVTGRQAQFGRGIMEDVARQLLNEFATAFERDLTRGGREAEATAEPQRPVEESAQRAGTSDQRDETAGPETAPALDMAPLLWSLVRRAFPAVGIGGGLLVLLATLTMIGRRKRRGLRLKVDWRW